MRRLLMLLTVVLVVFVALNRQRIYLRDPLGAVYRNDVKQTDARVFINYSNDVLIQSGDLAHMHQLLVQSWNGLPGAPVEMQCLQGLACLAQADLVPMVGRAGAGAAVMTNRQVTFKDADGATVRITLR